MKTTPTILLIADEPMLVVDMLWELECRGFAVVPMKPKGDWPQRVPCDAAILDLHGPIPIAQQNAINLRRQAIPIVVLGGGGVSHSSQWDDVSAGLSRPVDYDRLAALLSKLVSQSSLRNAPNRGAGVHEHGSEAGLQLRMASQ